MIKKDTFLITNLGDVKVSTGYKQREKHVEDGGHLLNTTPTNKR